MTEEFMNKAIQLSSESIGGPFGAIITKNNIIIAESSNSVIPDKDPTAHAEMCAIRSACKKLDSHCLNGCVLYTSCEPCCMCLSACYWAGIKEVYYANTRKDAESIGFSDKYIHTQLRLPHNKKSITLEKKENKEAKKIFQNWKGKIY